MGSLVRNASLAAALAASIVTIPAAAANAGQTLRLSDLRKTVGVVSPKISPDGTRVAVVLRRNDYANDHVVTDLMLVDVRTRASRTLVSDGDIASFQWSPNGTSIAYIGKPKYGEEKAPQLFVLPLSGGEPIAVTHEKDAVDDFDWRPDGAALAYSAVPDSPDAKAIEHHEDAFNVTEEAWTEQEPTSLHQLYEVPLHEGGKPHHIGNGSWSLGGGFSYAPDGKSLFVTRLKAGAHPHQYHECEIIRIRFSDGAIHPIAELSPEQRDPLRSFDGKYTAYTFGNPHAGMQTEAALADSTLAHPQWLSKALDRNIGSMAFAPDDTLVVAANDGTRRSFFRLTASSHAALPLGEISVVSAPSIARSGAIAFTGSTPAHANELYVLEPHAVAPTRLTNVNAWIDRYAIGRHQTITWRTRDGLEADGVLIYPPSFDKARASDKHRRFPLVLYIHGGPTSASLTSFSGFADVLPSHEWFVFEPNYRGSDNLGAQFARTTVPHISSVPANDIEDGIAAVLKLGVVDPASIAVSGWSEGGLMTSWLITHDTRWKAAVSGAAVNDWVSYDAMTDSKDFTSQFIAPNEWTNSATMTMFHDESPLSYASRVKTPTLILSDAGDFRVPTPLAYTFYHEIRATGTPVKFVVWPVVGHFPRDPVRVEDVSRQWEAWLVDHLKP